MNIDTLKYFQYVAKYKNITSAAKHLYISQSTLSRYIMTLEEELGVRLFERNNKQMELTTAGKVFLDDSDSFLNHMNTVIKNVQSADQGHSGLLRITLPRNLYPILMNPLAIMQKEHPLIKLVVESYNFDEIPSAIKYNLYDIGLTYDFVEFDNEDVHNLPIGEEMFSVVVSSKFAETYGEDAVSFAVRSLPIFIPMHAEPPFMKSVLSALQEHAGECIIDTHYSNTTESVVLNACLGLGYGIVPLSWERMLCNGEDATFLPMPVLPDKSKINMLYKKSNTSMIVNNFLKIIREVSRDQVNV